MDHNNAFYEQKKETFKINNNITATPTAKSQVSFYVFFAKKLSFLQRSSQSHMTTMELITFFNIQTYTYLINVDYLPSSIQDVDRDRLTVQCTLLCVNSLCQKIKNLDK